MDEGYGSFCDELKSLFDKYFANRTLLVTIHQAIFPITQEVLHRVFSPYGSIQKIVPFSKSVGVQFLIEYQGYGAVAASRSLQRRNIYDNCCQLHIQFWDDPGVTDFECGTLLEDSGDLKVFDKMVVRKIEVQDGEIICMNSGSSNMKFEGNPEKFEVIMEDESMDIVEDLHGADAVSRALISPSVASSAVLIKNLDASSKGCIQLIQVTFQPSPCLDRSLLLGSSNLNLNHVIEKPSWNLEGIVDLVTGISINELNLVHSVKLKKNGNISKLNFARKVYSRRTSIFGSNMVRRTPNEIDFGTAIDKLSGLYALRDRVKKFSYESVDVQFEKLERECSTRLIDANELIKWDDPYEFRLLLMDENEIFGIITLDRERARSITFAKTLVVTRKRPLKPKGIRISGDTTKVSTFPVWEIINEQQIVTSYHHALRTHLPLCSIQGVVVFGVEGEYAVIRSLIRVLEGGVEGKRQVDKVIDKCASMQNLREAISIYRNSILRQPDEMKREASLSFFVEYLESFADWMKARPELHSIIHMLFQRDTMGSLGYASLNPSLTMVVESADRRPHEVDVVAALRNGEVLGSQTVLKIDHCLGCQNASLPERIDSAPNFREVSGFPVYRVAAPIIDGIRSFIKRIDSSKGGHPIFWHNMREEHVIYINGRPFVLSEVERPYKNMLECTVIDRERVERMEAWLKEDILRGAQRYSRTRQEEEVKAAKFSKGQARIREVQLPKNVAKLHIAEARMQELKANMKILDKEVAVVLTVVEAQQESLNLQGLVAIAEREKNYHLKVDVIPNEIEDDVQLLPKCSLCCGSSIDFVSLNGSITIGLIVVAVRKRAMGNVWSNHLKKSEAIPMLFKTVSSTILGWLSFHLILEDKDYFEGEVL